MRLLKPTWVSHKGQPIFSVDIHPDGSRFATGGQGEDAGKIVIWNMAPVRNEADELDESVPKVLCQMDNHLACVNCVRWSHSGKCLASAGDDKLIMIWQTSRYGVGSTVFGSDSKIVESWRPVCTLRGHTGDVLDLSWSPNDAWLASCSIDNTIVIWNAEKFPEQIAVLKGHTGLVKGVTWDPVGKYLASQSDDKTLRIWRTRDWQQDASITEPFTECGGTTHVLRLDWSPDGHYIVSAHAMNNSGPTAQIIEREGWKATLDFVGHRKAITVVRFNPDILSKKLKQSSGKAQQYTCCAIGSRDRSLSIWLTALKRPLVVMHDLFTNSILDISWGHNGLELICCSHDGSVAYMEFTLEEIGSPLAKNDVHNLLEKIYGKMLPNTSNCQSSQIIESAAMLNLQQQQKQKDLDNKSQMSDKSDRSLPATPSKVVLTDDGKSPFKPKDKQIETKTADGRRRITPIFLAPQPSMGDIPQPFSSKSIEFTSSNTGSRIVVEKQNIVTGAPVYKSPSSRSQSLQSPAGPLSGSEGTPKASGEGKGVTPKSQSSPGSGDGKLTTPKSQLSPGTEKEKEKTQITVSPLSALHAESKPSEKKETPKQSSAVDRLTEKDLVKDKGKSLSLKRRLQQPDGQPKKRGRPRLIEKEISSRTTTVIPTPVTAPPAEQLGTARYAQVPSELLLPVSSVERLYSRQVPGKFTGSVTVALEVENNVQAGATTLHKLKFTKGGNLTWEQVLTSRIIAVTASGYVACAACEDRSISVFTAEGRKALPNLVISQKVSVLDANGHYFMAITRNGSVYVWNSKRKKVVIKNESLTSIMKGGETLEKTSLTADGVPVITISNQKSFTFSTDMGCWVLVHDRNDTLQHCSDQHSAKPRDSLKLTGPLASVQLTQERVGSQAGRTFHGGQNLQQLSTLNHLETQVESCLSLQSGVEYKFWLLTYVRYLVQEGFENRLREVCNELLGPLYRSKNSSTWEEVVLGINKRSLLKEILPLFSSNLTLQRLYTEYQEQLESIDR